MKILELKLTNFRCFESVTIPFDTKHNVQIFVGDNGAGKSAVLDAIALGLAPIVRRFKQTPGGVRRGLLDITQDSRNASPGIAVFDESAPRPFNLLQFKGQISNTTIEWDTHLLRDNSKKTKETLPRVVGYKQLYDVLDEDIFRVAESPDGSSGTVPVFAYYGTNRAALDIPRRKRDFRSAFSREAALNLALNPASRFKDAFEWFFAMERDELAMQNKKRDFKFKLPILEAVRKAIHSMLPDFVDPRITTHPLHFELSRKNPDGSVTDLYAEQLSGGYLTMLGLVMDFARRLAQANPKQTDPLSSEALLLIDEIDLHLHPDWQQRIVPDLQRTFPKTQLVLTTHSPQVLSTVHKDTVLILDQIHRPQPIPEDIGTFGAESSRVLQEIFGVPIRPPQIEMVEKLRRYLFLVESRRQDTDEGRALRVTLEENLGRNDPDLLAADVRISQLNAFKRK